MKYLQRYWSEVNDGQGDCYSRMVTAGTRPHTRSRNHELPTPGYYSAFPNAPLHEPREGEESNAVHDGITPPHGQSSVGVGHGSTPQTLTTVQVAQARPPVTGRNHQIRQTEPR